MTQGLCLRVMQVLNFFPSILHGCSGLEKPRSTYCLAGLACISRKKQVVQKREQRACGRNVLTPRNFVRATSILHFLQLLRPHERCSEICGQLTGADGSASDAGRKPQPHRHKKFTPALCVLVPCFEQTVPNSDVLKPSQPKSLDPEVLSLNSV